MTWICEDCGRRVDDSVQSHKEHRDTCKAQGGGMNAIEAVGKALANYAGDDYDFEHGQKELYMDMARAALTALRDNEVTEGMVEAWVIVPPTPDCDPAENCANEFRAMLDAALNVGNGE